MPSSKITGEMMVLVNAYLADPTLDADDRSRVVAQLREFVDDGTTPRASPALTLVNRQAALSNPPCQGRCR